ncbi:hypothetical Protein YC6258_01331 [Gynuella sunshinyii YC6258]|uniref:Uncharacterized protein n=1 Tax=Gynuella sunshinyii YC6258 TaxID=1445510 RepID=A0A0C5VST4_9GAMM|nr:hypothetical Protein YC6258_01331 [Gynuella sunshinyii YC6258]
MSGGNCYSKFSGFPVIHNSNNTKLQTTGVSAVLGVMCKET